MEVSGHLCAKTWPLPHAAPGGSGHHGLWIPVGEAGSQGVGGGPGQLAPRRQAPLSLAFPTSSPRPLSSPISPSPHVSSLHGQRSCCLALRFYFCTFRFLPRGWLATAESSGIFKASWSWSRMWRPQISSSLQLLKPPRTGHPGCQGRLRMTGGVHHGGAWTPGWTCTHGGGAAAFQVSDHPVNPFRAPTSHPVWAQAWGAV